MKYDYFLQDSPLSLRRYPKGSEVGELWVAEWKCWSVHCARRASCLLTKDREITEQEAQAFIRRPRAQLVAA